ncbi:hypothetical protein PR048_028702 [Dryococelus australis]|uniref:Uncharacterized protein n=1 Tax=Dryococelus australis TaxID=614101 RepID=A0ABQ9GBB3_9NEOP|nr:hypothetical protein PR048_028702 [Dryococelus australis]
MQDDITLSPHECGAFFFGTWLARGGGMCWKKNFSGASEELSESKQIANSERGVGGGGGRGGCPTERRGQRPRHTQHLSRSCRPATSDHSGPLGRSASSPDHTHGLSLGHCTPLYCLHNSLNPLHEKSPARSGDGTLVARDSVALIAPPLPGLKNGKKTQADPLRADKLNSTQEQTPRIKEDSLLNGSVGNGKRDAHSLKLLRERRVATEELPPLLAAWRPTQSGTYCLSPVDMAPRPQRVTSAPAICPQTTLLVDSPANVAFATYLILNYYHPRLTLDFQTNLRPLNGMGIRHSTWTNIWDASKKPARTLDILQPTADSYHKLLASHTGEPGSIPGRVTPGFLQVGIVPDDAAGRKVYSGISRFAYPCIPVQLHSHLISSSQDLLLRVGWTPASTVKERGSDTGDTNTSASQRHAVYAAIRLFVALRGGYLVNDLVSLGETRCAKNLPDLKQRHYLSHDGPPNRELISVQEVWRFCDEPGWRSGQTTRLAPRRIGFDFRWFQRGFRMRGTWRTFPLAGGFSQSTPILSPLHSTAGPSSPHFTGAEDLYVKSRPKPLNSVTHLGFVRIHLIEVHTCAYLPRKCRLAAKQLAGAAHPAARRRAPAQVARARSAASSSVPPRSLQLRARFRFRRRIVRPVEHALLILPTRTPREGQDCRLLRMSTTLTPPSQQIMSRSRGRQS